jgi:putative flippase GtrA
VKYGLVGASNTIVQFAVYSVGVTIGSTTCSRSCPATVAGALNSYILNRHWTFRARDIAHTTAGSRFAVVTGGAIA